MKQENIFTKAGDNVKKILFSLLLVALVPNIAIAHEFKTPLASGVVAQFDDIIINGQTANEAFSSTKQKNA